MIERYVFLKLKDAHSNADGRRAVIDHTRDVLPKIPGVVEVTVGEPADGHAVASWDVSIVVRFDKIEDAEPYRVHPVHRAYVDEFLKPRLEVIKAWNFDVG